MHVNVYRYTPTFSLKNCDKFLLGQARRWWFLQYVMRRSRKFCQGGPTLTTFFYWWGERWSKYNYKQAIIGPPAKRHLNGPILNAGLTTLWLFSGSWPILQRNPIFCDFSGRVSGPHVPPLDPHMHVQSLNLPWSLNLRLHKLHLLCTGFTANLH